MSDKFTANHEPGTGFYTSSKPDSFRLKGDTRKSGGENKHEPFVNPFKENAENAAVVLGGVLVTAAVKHVRDKIRDKIKKEKSEMPKTPEKEKELDFTQIEDRLFGSQKIESEERKELESLRQERIDEFKKLDQGRLAEELSISVRRTLRDNDWDDVYDELLQVGRNFETQMRGRSEIPDHLNGIAQSAVRYESARVLKAGIVKQARDLGGYEKAKKWIKNKKADQYSDDELIKIDELAQRSFVHLAPDAPEELVGRNIMKEESVIPPEPQQPEIKVVVSEKEAGAGFESQLEEKVRKLKTENAEASQWARVILEGIDFAEKESDKERKKSVGQEEKPEYWKAIEKAIQEIPSNLGTVDKNSALAKFLTKEHKDGLTFKDRISLLFSARRHLNDRFVEMSRAGGSLTKMGVSDEMPFEGISYKVQPISPQDFEMLYHQRELFPELATLSITELNELLPDLDESSCKWLDIGIKNNSLPEDLMLAEEAEVVRKILANKDIVVNYYNDQLRQGKIDEAERSKKILEIGKMSIDSDWVSFELFMKPLMDAKILNRDDVLIYAYIPTFDNSLNNATTGAELRNRMANSLKSSKGEDLAFRVLTNTLTFEMLDRGRSNVQGSSDPRDIMWVERKRLFEMMKEREPGLDWTVHRYFVTRPDPEEVIRAADAKNSKKLEDRREKLAINAERGILVEKPDYFEGEIVSDFFHNVMIFAPDDLKVGKSIRRNLATYVLNADNTVKKGGFKNMPFLEMGPESYSTAGYWGYTIAKGKQLASEISSITYKKADEELVDDGWWNKKRDLFARLEHISPRLITIEYKTRGKLIREILSADRRFDKNEIKKIAGYSEAEDLDVISDERLRAEALRIVSNPKNEIAKKAKEQSEKIRDSVIDKFRMVHALGVVWPGSIDATELTETFFGGGRISPDTLTKITAAIVASRYLEGEFLEQFKLECLEMGFGKKALGKKERYRIPVDTSLWS